MRMAAMTWGAEPVRVWDRSVFHVRSRTSCARCSVPQWPSDPGCPRGSRGYGSACGVTRRSASGWPAVPSRVWMRGGWVARHGAHVLPTARIERLVGPPVGAQRVLGADRAAELSEHTRRTSVAIASGSGSTWVTSPVSAVSASIEGTVRGDRRRTRARTSRVWRCHRAPSRASARVGEVCPASTRWQEVARWSRSRTGPARASTGQATLRRAPAGGMANRTGEPEPGDPQAVELRDRAEHRSAAPVTERGGGQPAQR